MEKNIIKWDSTKKNIHYWSYAIHFISISISIFALVEIGIWYSISRNRTGQQANQLQENFASARASSACSLTLCLWISYWIRNLKEEILSPIIASEPGEISKLIESCMCSFWWPLQRFRFRFIVRCVRVRPPRNSKLPVDSAAPSLTASLILWIVKNYFILMLSKYTFLCRSYFYKIHFFPLQLYRTRKTSKPEWKSWNCLLHVRGCAMKPKSAKEEKERNIAEC